MSEILLSDKDDLLLEETADGAREETLTVPPALAGERLDRVLSELSDLTRSAAVRLVESGFVTVQSGGKAVKADKKTRLKAGDMLTVIHPAVTAAAAEPEDIPLDIVYEDDDIIVINKPVGMVVHPAPGNERGTLVNALLFHCGEGLSGVGGVRRPGIVHRIDKDTSGLLVVAKNDEAHLGLSAQLKSHTVSRVYYAVCVGNCKEDGGTVDLAVGRNPNDRKRMAAFPKGTDAPGVREAVTHYTVLERYPIGALWGQSFTLVRCELETGRTHQIRVHMAATGHPLLGDPVYGGDGTRFGKSCGGSLTGQMLHAKELRLIHPRTKKPMHFACDLPENYLSVLEKLRKETDRA